MTTVALLVSVLLPLLVRSKNDNCGFVGVSVIAPTCQKQE